MKTGHRSMLDALKLLPPREPRGSPGNLIRAGMLPFLLQGLSPEGAKAAALKQLREILGIINEEAK